MVSVRIWCRVDELEDEEKVRRALENLFPTVSFKKEKDVLVGAGKRKDLVFLKEKIWGKKILDTVRAVLLRNLREKRTELLLHKQAAYAGKVGLVEFDDESPFGAIHVEICGNLEEFIDWFSPKTKEGKPILKSQQPSCFR